MPDATFPPLQERPLKDTICLFDVDGTLTPARLVRHRPVSNCNYDLKPNFPANHHHLLRKPPSPTVSRTHLPFSKH